MIKNIQSVSILKHCSLITAHKKCIIGYANPNQIRKYWLDAYKNSELTFKFNQISNPEIQKKLSPRNVRLLENKFTDTTNTFYYGPLGTCLWLVLSKSPNANMAMYDLCRILGVHPDQLLAMPDDELYFLAILFPDCLLHVFTYAIYRFNISSLMRDDVSKNKKLLAGRLELYFHSTDLQYFLALYGLNLNLLLDLNSDKTWYISKGIPDQRLQGHDTLHVTTEFGFQLTLGNYVSLALEDAKSKGFIDIFSDELHSSVLSPIDRITWEHLN